MTAIRDAVGEDVPRVSIITPSFNQSEYLEDCLLSVIHQNYPDLEHIVMDGGSSDDSAEILRRYSDRLAYWVSEPDGGQAAALNEALGRTSGDLIGWLNSDDLYLPGTIDLVVQAFRDNPEAVVIYGACHVIDAESTWASTIWPGTFSVEKLAANNFLMQTATFFRRDILDANGTFDAKIKYAIDYDYWLRAVDTFDDKFLFLPKPLACFRDHPGSQSFRDAVPALIDEIDVRRKFAASDDFQSRYSRHGYELFMNPLRRLILMASTGSRIDDLLPYLRSELDSGDPQNYEWDALECLLKGDAKTGSDIHDGLAALSAVQEAWSLHHGVSDAPQNADESLFHAELLIFSSLTRSGSEATRVGLSKIVIAVRIRPRTMFDATIWLLLGKLLLGRRIYDLLRSTGKRLRRLFRSRKNRNMRPKVEPGEGRAS